MIDRSLLTGAESEEECNGWGRMFGVLCTNPISNLVLLHDMVFLIPQYSLTDSFIFFHLPRPDLTTKKRRGGKRIRRLKERFEETELMKQANKRAFSVEAGEYGDDAMGITLGMLDTKEGGAMRNTTEKRKMRQANTKASRKRAVQMSSGVTNGLASSVVFTPTQGMELVNPDANKERVRQANDKWFSQNAGFQSALPKK